jgi:hypothetical protein
MRKLMILLAVAAAPALAPRVAMADPPQAQAQGQTPQNVTVNANRPICRRTTQTASRMGSGSVCHTAAEWQRLGVRMTSTNTSIDEASQTLDTVGQSSTTGGGNAPH